jgi:hypothetical protein
VSQLIIIHRYKTFIIGSRFFLPAAEFFWWPGRNILPGVGNTAPVHCIEYTLLTCHTLGMDWMKQLQNLPSYLFVANRVPL